MRRTFILDAEPFSINAYHTRDKRFKSRNALDWEASIFWQLSKDGPQKALKELREVFDPAKHRYKMQLIAYYPKHIYFTKQGLVSGKMFDITNIEKPLVDLLFLGKYHNLPSPEGCPNLNIDDKYLSSLYSEKLPSPTGRHMLKISLKIVKAHTP